MVKTSVLYGGQRSTIIYTSVGGRSRKNSAPTGSGGGGEVITGNKVLKPVAWDQLGSAWILAQYAPTTPFTCCTDVETGKPVYMDFKSLASSKTSVLWPLRVLTQQCKIYNTPYMCVKLLRILGNILDSVPDYFLSISFIKKVHNGSG